MRIPERKIDEILSITNIVDIVSDYVQLRKKGRNFTGLCPFHTEKTPSFIVSEEKQIFHCFGCHTGGNALKFLMEFERISYIEAIQKLAEKYNIQLEYDKTDNSEQNEIEILYDINAEAAKYFSNNLLTRAEGDEARKYFENRGIKVKTQREFGLGYALSGRDSLVNYFTTKKINIDKALSLGIISKGNDGSLYDRFAGRIIFPIFSPTGRVVGFGGRIMHSGTNSSKYVNSPESQLYNKSRVLYGLSFSKDEIRRKNLAVFVEGYMDLISLYQSGVKNVVSVSGTALTEEQIQLISRYTKNVVLLFDADSAGVKASMRSIELLLKKDMEIKIATLPAGEDPDSYINKNGKEAFENIVENGVNFLEYQTNFYKNQGDFEDPSRSAIAIKELVKMLALINDEIKRSLFLKSISRKFNLRELLLEDELDKITKKANKKNDAPARSEELQVIANSQVVDEKRGNFLNTIEREIVKLLVNGGYEVMSLIFQYIMPEEFSDERHFIIAEIVYSFYINNEPFNSSFLLERIQDEKLYAYIVSINMNDHTHSDKWEKDYGLLEEDNNRKMAKDLIKRFKIIHIDDEINDVKGRLATTIAEDEKKYFLAEHQQLLKNRTNISKEIDKV